MMTFEELRDQLKQLEVEESRFNMNDYVEFVVRSHISGKVIEILQSYFGRPVNLSHTETAEDALRFVEKWGGVRDNQTLYYLPRIDATDFAMIWPWCDGAKISVKVVHHKPFRSFQAMKYAA